MTKSNKDPLDCQALVRTPHRLRGLKLGLITTSGGIDTTATLEPADQEIGIVVVEGFLVDGAGYFRQDDEMLEGGHLF